MSVTHHTRRVYPPDSVDVAAGFGLAVALATVALVVVLVLHTAVETNELERKQ